MKLRHTSHEFDASSHPRSDAKAFDTRETLDWFVAQVKPNSGAIAQRNLEQQGFKTFMPQLRKTERKSTRFRETRRALFPGYIFVSVDTANGRWRAINNTYGVTRLVCFNARPTPLPSGFVDALQQRCDTEGLLKPVEELVPGELARITGGPFSDFLVRIEALDQDKRLWVLFDLLGRQTRIAVPRDALTRA
ncbi:MAG: transcriptional antiterminator RfaH [Rhodobacteraceae bacterium HLUCCA12]|nr:MAG: transcriptional antiterminator RfaH [Rhodobacteraceae bacterium HLUCCA12]